MMSPLTFRVLLEAESPLSFQSIKKMGKKNFVFKDHEIQCHCKTKVDGYCGNLCVSFTVRSCSIVK